MQSKFVVPALSLAFALALPACTAASGPPQNVGKDGSYGFDGDGWTRTENADHDEYWTKGPSTFSATIRPAESHDDAAALAEKRYSAFERATHDVPFLFAPKRLDATGGYWYGWYFESEGENVYEYVAVEGGHVVTAEISGPSLSESDASGTLGTLRAL